MVSATNASQAQARVLVDELVRAGLTDVALAPGSRSAPLALAAVEHEGVRVHVRLDERSAAFVALGLGRVSGRPAAVVTTSGTAAANVLPAVVEADQAGVGLLVLTADRPPELRGTAANQTIDQVKLYGSTVRWFCELGVAEARPDAAVHWRSVACRAAAEAAGAGGCRPGPVHLNCAFREPLVPSAGDTWPHPLDGRADGRPWTAVTAGTPQPASAAVEALAERAAAVERGLLVVGETDTDPAPLLAFAETVGWPVLAEPLSGARDGDRAVSTYDALLRTPAFAAAHRPDLVWRVGRVGLSKALLGLLDADVDQVLIDAHAAWLDPRRTVGNVVAADPATLAGAVSAALGGAVDRDGDWLTAWLSAERRARAAVDALLDAAGAPSEPRTARDLAAALPDGALLVAASSMPVRDLDAFAAPRSGLRVIGNRGASGIDGFTSTALGAAHAHAGATVALAGDLSVLHDAPGLLLPADEPRPDLVVVVVNNDGGGIFSLLPQADLPTGFERLFGTPHGVDLADLAAAADVGHRRVERADGLAGAVADAQAHGGVHLVEVRTERAANAALHRDALAAVADALAR